VNGAIVGESNNVINNNLIGSTIATKKIGYRGVFLANQSNIVISGNTIAGVSSTFYSGAEPDASGGIFVSGVNAVGNIFQNTISDIKNTNNTGAPSYGISLQTSTSNTGLKVYNNFIYNITGNGKNSAAIDNGMGIAILSGGGYGIYFNSVYLGTNQTTAGITADLFIGPSVANGIDLRNNIFSNRLTSGSRYAIYNTLTTAVFSFINYNDYFSSGSLGYLGEVIPTLGAWQAVTLSDGNSVNTNPLFVDPVLGNLHLQDASPLNNQAIAIAGITTDYDLAVRATPTDIGADDFTPPACAGSAGGVVANATSSILCVSGQVVLSCTGFTTGTGMNYQWENSPDGTTNWTTIAGETNPANLNTPTIFATTYYRLKVVCNAGVAGYSNVFMVTVKNPQIVSTAPASRCGNGVLTISATPNSGTSIQWFLNATGGAPIASGNSYTTPLLTSTKTYYAEPSFIGSNSTCGPLSPTAQGGTQSFQLTPWEVYFDVFNATTLASVDVFPSSSNLAYTIELYNSSNALIASTNFFSSVSGGATAQTVPLNFFILPDNGYYLYIKSEEPGNLGTGLMRNITGAVYPYTSTDANITGNGFSSSYFMCFYNWKFTNGCTVPRTAVTATISSPTAVTINATNANICNGNSTTLTASSTNAAYTYNWMPGNITGNSITVSPNVSTTYTVTASAGGCVTDQTQVINVTEAPSQVTLSPRNATKCGGIPLRIGASGASVPQTTIFSEKFNDASLVIPVGWDTTCSPVGSPGKWTARNNNYVWNSNRFSSNDSSRFFLTNSEAALTTVTSVLKLPKLNLTGYSNAKLYFWHHYQPFDGNGATPEVVSIERSSNPNATTWNVLWSKSNSAALPINPIGTTTSFRRDSVDLTALLTPFGGTGNTYNKPDSVYLRFRYFAYRDLWWAIDNIEIKGNATPPIIWTPEAGLFTDAAATIPYVSGTYEDTLFANPLTNTTYIATATSPNGCAVRDTSVITVRPTVSATITGTTTICSGNITDLNIAVTGVGPWTCTLRRVNGATVFDTTFTITTSPVIVPVSPTTTGANVYSIFVLTDANSCGISSANTATVTVTPTTQSIWTGASATPTSWAAAGNWCGAVPTTAQSAFIPAGLTNYPTISTITPAVLNLEIAQGATLTIANGAKLQIKGSVTNNGTLNNDGTIVLNASSALLTQTFPGGTTGVIPRMDTLEINRTAGTVTFDRKFAITDTGILKITKAFTININDTITIKSTALGTARIDTVSSTANLVYNNTGCFTIERYIPTGTLHNKSWQLLAAPTIGQTVKQAWQEGATSVSSNPKPGYGTTITSALSGATTSLGFDFYTPLGGTMKTYDNVSNSYVAISNTNQPITEPKGYMFFVRGDRSVTSGTAPAVPTTLRTTGRIYYGIGIDSAYTLTVPAGKCQSVGNPYASPIDFQKLILTSSGLDLTYYVWDPMLQSGAGLGAWQTISSFNGWKAIPGGTINYSTTIGNSRIQSGQAFFVYSTAGGTVRFTEKSKTNGTKSVFRNTSIDDHSFLRLNLNNASGVILDGNILAIDSSSSNAMDSNDALKLNNFGENIGIKNQDKLLSLDARQHIRSNDTLFYQISNFRNGSYQLEIIPENIASSLLGAILIDRYTNQQTVLNLMDTNRYDFTTGTELLSKAAGRFYIVFKELRPVPVTFLEVEAYKKLNDIEVKWKVANELNIANYEIEKSIDGVRFEKIASHNAGNISGLYTILDQNPVKGFNYFRIKSIGVDGQHQYSNVAKCWIESTNTIIAAIPNPIKNNKIELSFVHAAVGKYNFKLYNNEGQLLVARNTSHKGGNATHTIQPGIILPNGVYSLKITHPSGKIQTIKIAKTD